tara:strand:+ start:187 stop:384 length:198 start_codon:yes stop_codon:yes gene_type:complete
MLRYYKTGNLIVRTDSFDMEELSKPPYKKDIPNKDIPKDSTWKHKIVGNDNNDKNLTINNFPQLK